MKILTAKQSKILDDETSKKYLIPSILLMEQAASQTYQLIKERYCQSDKILIFAGAGNNGGDGLALARLLINNNYSVKIYLLAKTEKMSELCQLHYDILNKLNADITLVHAKQQLEANLDYRLIIDAIFGISLNREIKGIYKTAIQYINEHRAEVLALDLPSGINADTGEIYGLAVKAQISISFGYGKRGCYLFPASDCCGKIHIANIGFPPQCLNDLIQTSNFGTILEVLDKEDYPLPQRAEDSHKGTYGTTCLICGSKTMAGAALLAAKACYKSGVGIVRVLSHKANRNALIGYLPEAIFDAYSDDDEAEELSKVFATATKKAKVILIGCGLGNSQNAKTLLDLTLNSDKTLVLDADALNMMAGDKALKQTLKQRQATSIITPHLAEMARLCGLETKEVNQEPLVIAQQSATNLNALVVLKSARTVIASPSGDLAINIKGNNGMATGGSGDVLAGIIAGMITSFDSSIINAVKTAVLSHALAGDRAKINCGERALLASDIIEALNTL